MSFCHTNLFIWSSRSFCGKEPTFCSFTSGVWKLCRSDTSFLLLRIVSDFNHLLYCVHMLYWDSFFFFFHLFCIFWRDLNVSEFVIFCGSISYDLHCTGTKALWLLNITSCLFLMCNNEFWVPLCRTDFTCLDCLYHPYICNIGGLKLDQICSVLLLLFYLFSACVAWSQLNHWGFFLNLFVCKLIVFFLTITGKQIVLF